MPLYSIIYTLGYVFVYFIAEFHWLRNGTDCLYDFCGLPEVTYEWRKA